MSTPEVKSALGHAERGLPIRALLIGLVVALAVGVIGILSLGNSAVSPSGGSVLVLAPAAFLAGVVSFLSPCTLPILPAYFAFTFQARRDQILRHRRGAPFDDYAVAPDGQRFLVKLPADAAQRPRLVVMTNWPSLLRTPK